MSKPINTVANIDAISAAFIKLYGSKIPSNDLNNPKIEPLLAQCFEQIIGRKPDANNTDDNTLIDNTFIDLIAYNENNVRPIKTTLPDSINSIEEAQKYLTELYNNDESYHCDDSAGDCLQGISEQDASHMDCLMNEVHKYLSDPCLFLLQLSGHNMED